MRVPNFGGGLLRVQSWQYHAPFTMNILNGQSEAMNFVAQLGVDVNKMETDHDLVSGRSFSTLLRESSWQVADARRKKEKFNLCRREFSVDLEGYEVLTRKLCTCCGP